MLNTASLSWELEWAVLDCTAKQFKQMTNRNPSVFLPTLGFEKVAEKHQPLSLTQCNRAKPED